MGFRYWSAALWVDCIINVKIIRVIYMCQRYVFVTVKAIGLAMSIEGTYDTFRNGGKS